MTKVLWLSPNFNHYKARFLKHLAEDKSIKLSVLSGTGRIGSGDKELSENWNFDYQRINVSKKNFGFSLQVFKFLNKRFVDFDWILVPVEKKNFLVFIYCVYSRFWMKQKNKNVRLISYCHPLLKSGNGKTTLLDKWLTKFHYNRLDRVVFYTKDSSEWAIKKNYVDSKLAFWANNTIDTEEINNNYSFSYPLKKPKHIIFIGRLIPSKKVDTAIEYFELLQKHFGSENLILDIIGDGPESYVIEKACLKNKNIIWHGALINESKIAPIMKNGSIVFLPGDSGLSINHAFAYGRPYVTLTSKNHGPEISYISSDKNGFILDKKMITENLKIIIDLLSNETKLHEFCDYAKLKGEELSIDNWVEQIKGAFLSD